MEGCNSVIDLHNIKTIYICPDHNAKYAARKTHMEKLLTDMGFLRFEHFKSGTDAYPACLSRAIIDILRENMDEPVLILEDDIETDVSGGSALMVKCPPGTDAIYLGISRHGGSSTKNHCEGSSLVTSISPTQVRILNMLSSHAVIYISRSYKEAVIAALEGYTTIPYYNDVLISRLQARFMVIANKKPMFWQSNAFNHPHDLERATKFEF